MVIGFEGQEIRMGDVKFWDSMTLYITVHNILGTNLGSSENGLKAFSERPDIVFGTFLERRFFQAN